MEVVAAVDVVVVSSVVVALDGTAEVVVAIDVVEEALVAGTTGVVEVELVPLFVPLVDSGGILRSEPGPEVAGLKGLGKMATPSSRNEFSIISRVVRKFTNGCPFSS